MRRISMVGLVLLALLAAACSSTPSTTPRIVQTSFTSTAETIALPASSFRVVVTATGPCFVQVGNEAGVVVFAHMLPAGQMRTFSTRSGRLSVILGSFQVKVSAQIDGARVASWHYTPKTAPFRLNFVSVS